MNEGGEFGVGPVDGNGGCVAKEQGVCKRDWERQKGEGERVGAVGAFG